MPYIWNCKRLSSQSSVRLGSERLIFSFNKASDKSYQWYQLIVSEFSPIVTTIEGHLQWGIVFEGYRRVKRHRVECEKNKREKKSGDSRGDTSSDSFVICGHPFASLSV